MRDSVLSCPVLIYVCFGKEVPGGKKFNVRQGIHPLVGSRRPLAKVLLKVNYLLAFAQIFTVTSD